MLNKNRTGAQKWLIWFLFLFWYRWSVIMVGVGIRYLLTFLFCSLINLRFIFCSLIVLPFDNVIECHFHSFDHSKDSTSLSFRCATANAVAAAAAAAPYCKFHNVQTKTNATENIFELFNHFWTFMTPCNVNYRFIKNKIIQNGTLYQIGMKQRFQYSISWNSVQRKIEK